MNDKVSGTGDFTSLDHIIIAVNDLPAAEAAYTTIFGRAPSWRGIHPGRGTGNVLYRLENTYVEVMGVVGEGPGADDLTKRLDERGEGLYGIVLGISNAAEVSATLKARGFPAGEAVGGSGRDEITGQTRHWNLMAMPSDATRGLFMLGIEHLDPADSLPKAPLLEGVSEAETISGSDHVVVMTADGDAMKDLFSDTFGIRLALDQTKPEWGVRQLFYRLGGATIEIVQSLDPAKAPKSDNYMGLAWTVTDIAATQARLAAAGFDVSEVRKGRKPGTAVCTIRNKTSGVLTLLVGPA